MTQWAWILDLPRVLHPKPEAALLRWAAVMQASLWRSIKWSDWSNRGTWTPTGGVFLRPYISERALTQAKAIIYHKKFDKKKKSRKTGWRMHKIKMWQENFKHTYIFVKGHWFPNLFDWTTPTSPITTKNTPNLHLQWENWDQKKNQNYKMASWPSLGSILEASKPGVFVNPHRAEKVAHKKGLRLHGAKLMLYRQFLWFKKL